MRQKRLTGPKQKAGVLAAGWTTLRKYDADGYSDIDPTIRGDLLVSRGEGCAKADGHLLVGVLAMKRPRVFSGVFDPSFLEELVRRGYDLTTLRFSVSKKPTHAVIAAQPDGGTHGR